MNEELTIRFAQAVAHTLWQGVIIALLAWALAKVFRKRPARQHGVLGGAMLLLAILLPVNYAVLSKQDVPPTTTFTSESEVLKSGAGEGEELVEFPEAIAVTESGARASDDVIVATPGPDAPSSVWIRFAPWVTGVYAAGLLAMLARLVFAWGGGRRLRKRSQTIREERWLDSLEKSLARLAMKTKPALRWSEEVAAPVLVGLAKPMILLPVALANRLTLAQAEAVLAHELAHLRRRDHWVLAIQRLVETVLFYHPVVWWLSRELTRTREEACDDLVLASGSQPADYAEALVLCSEARFERAGLAGNAAVQLAASGGKGSSLRKRVMRVLGKEEAIRPGNAGWWMVGVMVAVAAIVVAGAVPEGGKEQGSQPGETSGEREGMVQTELTPLYRPIQRGETLAEIAMELEMTVEYLRKLNPGLATTGLRAGQELVVAHQGMKRSKDVPDQMVIFQLVIAEVPHQYGLTAESVTVAALQGHNDAEILATPIVMGWSGEEAELSLSVGDDRVPARDSWIAITLKPTFILGEVDFAVRITRSDPEEGGAVRTQQVEVSRSIRAGKREAFEVAPLKEGRKLVASVKFTVVTTPAGVRRQEADPVFYLLVDGRVRWRGDFYNLEELKDALPKEGEGPVFVEAGKETPYRHVVALMEVLVPVFGNDVKFRVTDEEGEARGIEAQARREERRLRAAQEAEREAQIAAVLEEIVVLEAERAELLQKYKPSHPVPLTIARRIEALKAKLADVQGSNVPRFNPGEHDTTAHGDEEEHHGAAVAPEEIYEEMDSDEAQLAQCRRELLAMELERAELVTEFTDDHPEVRRIERRIETAKDYIRDLEAALAKRKAVEADASADGNAAVWELLEKAAQPSPDLQPPAEVERLIRRRVAETELAERLRILESLRAAGRQADDPEVNEMERRIEALRESLEQTRDEVEEPTPEEDDSEEQLESDANRDDRQGFLPERIFNPDAVDLGEMAEWTRVVVAGPEGARTEGIVPETDLSGLFPTRAPEPEKGRPYFAWAMAQRIERVRQANPEERDEDQRGSPVRRVQFLHRESHPYSLPAR